MPTLLALLPGEGGKGLEHRKEGLRTPPDQSASGRTSRVASATDRRRLARWWAAIACSALLLYGSFLPFDINPLALTRADGFGLSQIEFHDASLEDAVVNLLIYIPLGLSVAAGISLRHARRTSADASPLEKGGLEEGRIVIAVALSTAFSVVVEAMQTASPSRMASWTDVALNTLGGGIGVFLAVFLGGRMRSIIRRLAQALADHPFNTTALVLTLALLVYNLAPFDFVTTPRDLHASFGRARIIPIRLPDPSAAVVQAKHWVGDMQGAAWFLVLGYLLALAGREIGRHPASAFTSALKQGAGLAGLIEFMQLFTRSHSFDAFSIVLRAIGVAFGAWCAVFLVDAASHSQWRRRPGLAVPTPLLALAALFQAAELFVPALVVRRGSLHGLHWSAMSVPFESLSRAPASAAAMDIASKLLIYGSLVFTVAVMLRRFRIIRPRRTGLVACGCVVILAALAELLRSATGAHAPDGTVVLLTTLSGFLVHQVDRFVRGLTPVENTTLTTGRALSR